MGLNGATFDHAAIGVADLSLAHAWVEAAGGVMSLASTRPGFRAEQWLFRNGMCLELLAPHCPEENDFMERFVARNGSGPHHLTFMVEDAVEAVTRLEEAGFPILGSHLDDPAWREAFMHPRDACGTVVQIAETDSPVDRSSAPRATSEFVAVTLEVADLARANLLYVDLLGGLPSEGPDGIVLSWPNTGSIRLRQSWDTARSGHIDSLVFRGTELTERFAEPLGVNALEEGRRRSL
ncbi:VOC family protein [Streptomyces sp. NPDC005549]|uniref:VOC family protein n=1 Tax=Streptomyces sp. NPDC005549 TaxID=3154888 RepID=UPI0033B597BB